VQHWKNFHTTQKDVKGSLAKDVSAFLQFERPKFSPDYTASNENAALLCVGVPLPHQRLHVLILNSSDSKFHWRQNRLICLPLITELIKILIKTSSREQSETVQVLRVRECIPDQIVVFILSERIHNVTQRCMRSNIDLADT
jgi:hypothetical protein